MVAISFMVACAAPGGTDEQSREPVARGRAPRPVELNASQVTLGFPTGRMREAVDVPAFELTKHPITRADYARCVKAGACKDADEPGCAEQSLALFAGFRWDDDASPAVCVGADNGAAYCGWIGGRLPRLSEWMYAARGPEPARFPWGAREATCEQHPLALQPIDPNEPTSSALNRRPCHAGAEPYLIKTGSSPGPKGEGGAQDFLLLTAELVAADPASLWNACSPAIGSACLVYGREAGAIEDVTGIATPTGSAKVEPSTQLYTFRCVVED